MNREILFRGKQVDNGAWIYGYYAGPVALLDTYEICDISDPVGTRSDVDPTTICQYTGMTDKNGVKIFEGDIVSIPGSKKMGLPAEVYYFSIDGSFCLRRYGYSRICLENSDEWALIVGNIHDNPELLGGNDGTTD